MEQKEQNLGDVKHDQTVSKQNEENQVPSTTETNVSPDAFPLAPCRPNRYATYPKLPGAVDSGKEFEQTMSAYYALTLSINAEVKDFQMTSNHLSDGKFDDIGLKVTFNNGKHKRFLLQLKHKDNKSINLSDLRSESKNNDFGVKRYLKSITEMNLDKHTVCILYTNCPTRIKDKIELTDETSFEKCDQMGFEIFLANTKRDSQNTIFEVKSGNLRNRFYFFTSQMNVRATEKQINSKLKSLVQSDILVGFLNYMRTWWSGKFILTKHDVIVKISELAFSPYLRILSDAKCNEKTESLSETIMKFPLTIVEECEEDIIQNIWKSEESWIDEDFRRARNKYGLREDQRNTTLWYLGKVPLVVKVDGSNEVMVKRVMNFLRNDIEDKKIILVGQVSRTDFGQWKSFESLWDVVQNHDHYSDIMKTFYISFQGRDRTSLENLVKADEDVAKLIGTSELLKMSQQEFLLVGNQKEELPDLHIPRCISPIFIRTQDVLSTCRSSRDMMVIINCDQTFENQLSINRDVNPIELSEYILVSGSTDEKRSDSVLLSKKGKCTSVQFEKVCDISKRANIYLLQPFDDAHCIVLSQRGADLKSAPEDTMKTIKEREIFNHYNTPLHVLCALPGMGKSTLMKVLYNSCPSDCLAVYVALINYNWFLATRPDFEMILARFLETDGEERDLLKFKEHFSEKHKLYMFLDGLDEVNSQHIDCIFNFVKQASSQGVNVWLSSRENLLNRIRQALNVVPIDIKELGKEEQQEYIINKLKKSYANEEIDKIMLTIFSSTDLNNSQTLLGIPLQLHIITEMFLNDSQVFEHLERKNFFVLTQMYKVFLEGKIKFAINKLVDKNQELQLGFVKYLLQAYEILALKACLSPIDYKELNLAGNEDKDLLHQLKTEGDKYGIVKTITPKDEIIFSHQTYAEYFAATWFKKNKDKIVLIQDRIFSSEYDNFRLLFDVVLAENNPLHLAIIYQDPDRFENHIGDVNRTDHGGRTVFHLAFSYGQKYDSDFNFYKERNKRETSFYVKIIERILQEGNLSKKKDELFGFDCVSYALHSKCLYPIEKLLEKNLLDFDQIENQLYRYYEVEDVVDYSAQFGFPNLLHGCTKKYQHGLKALTEFAIIGCLYDDTPTTEGNVEAARILIERGAPLEGTLERACEMKRFNMLEILVKNGAKCKHGDTMLHVLVRNCPEKYCEEITSAIKKFHLSVNAKDSKGATALHKAAQNADSKILEVLVKNSADLNVLDCDSRNALHYAAKNFRTNVTKLLLDEGLDVNAQDDRGTTPLHLALEEGNTDIVKLLLERGADLKLADDERNSVLHYASRSTRNNSSTILLLMSKCLNVNQENHERLTPLHLACQYGHFKNVETLLDQGADPNFVDKKGENALHHAVNFGWDLKEPVVFLINKGVDVNAQNREGTTALHKAVASTNLEILEVLERNGADLNMLDYNGRGILHYASKNFRTSVLKSVLSRGLSVNVQDVNGVAPMHLALKEGNTVFVELLLEQGAKLQLVDHEENNALHYAAKSKNATRSKHYNTIKLLINEGIGVNAKNRDGFAPIHFAYMADNLERVASLLRKGAKQDVNAKFKNGETLLHMVCKLSNPNLPIKLLKGGADPNSVDNHKRNALHYHLLQFYDQKLVHAMINYGLNLNTRYENGQTLLHIVCLHGDTLNLRKLVEEGVDVNVLDENRQSPLQSFLKSLAQMEECVLEDFGSLRHVYVTERQHKCKRYQLGCEGCYARLLKNLLRHRSDASYVDLIKLKFFEVVGTNERIVLLLRHILNTDMNLATGSEEAMYRIVARFIIFEMIDYLLENGAVVNNVSSFNKTATDYASELEEKFPEITNLFRHREH